MIKLRRVAFHTLGCKLNFAETDTIGRLFGERGFSKVGFGREADVVVINTCTVTGSADKKCRNIIGRATRTSPEAFLVVVGCYSQLKAEEIAGIPGVDLVLGSREKFRIFEYAGDFVKREKPGVHVCEIGGQKDFTPSYSISGRTRSFLKVQDGCDYYCSYCTIPLARGRSRSASIQDIIRQARDIEEKGIREVVLTGVNIGDFGKGGRGSLLELLTMLDSDTGIDRFRLSSVEPDLLDDGIISFIAGNSRFSPHFHMPLQSGSDRVLKLMKRKYTTALFAERVKHIREVLPFAGIGADVITGFPGETETDFNTTLQFIEDTDVSFLHIFTYSDREGTRAAAMGNKVAPLEKEHRSRILHRLADGKKTRFQRRCIGQVHRVLFEAYNKKGRMYGFTGNYLRVEAIADEKAVNRMAEVELVEIAPGGTVKGMVRAVE